MPKDQIPALTQLPVPVELVERRIYFIRGQKVMLDSDLAKLYQVLTKNLNLAVRRNTERFPQDFMFELTKEEFNNLRLQIATSSSAHGGRRYLPRAFTELGVAMLSSVLKSKRAIQMNILIMRAFVRLRELLATNKDLARRIEKLEAGQRDHAMAIGLVAEDVLKLAKSVRKEIQSLKVPRRRKIRIGFCAGEKKPTRRMIVK